MRLEKTRVCDLFPHMKTKRVVWAVYDGDDYQGYFETAREAWAFMRTKTAPVESEPIAKAES